MHVSDTRAEKMQSDIIVRQVFSALWAVLEKYSFTIIRIVSGIECSKRRFLSSSKRLCISSVTVKVYFDRICSAHLYDHETDLKVQGPRLASYRPATGREGFFSLGISD
jgi:hypothetical protein